MNGATATLAIDAGQTSVKVRLRDGDRATEWSAPGVRTDGPLLPQLAAVVDRAVAEGHAFERLALGVSGLESAHAEAAGLLERYRRGGVRSVHIAHDSVSAFLGALGDGRGAVVAAGTGVVTLAVGRTEVARVDGWGHLIGDAGSGYWIGRAGLDAVMRAHDGRGDATALTDLVRADFPDLERAYLELQADADRVRRTAGYARAVTTAAAEGDPVAAAVLGAAGRELALSALAGLRRTGEDAAERPRVRGIGGVFTAPALAEAFTREVCASLPGADVAVGESNPLDGAGLLPDVAESSALAARIAAASVPQADA
ncbi:N-acetylglucosamine kinase [Glycomyces tritici]|uniref:BadF/BadG/BcrA/BcrD ATPase family protein n=1 Tax=Glycomyces tritici TaxID=2665176 RepID=A0ABT7YQF1_9ACTN|nr:BadF/BadG/BcrA/BcrD ATPase family protein [Glycomyces tritici]MDN3240877.1 BadF/BadG/BcrA/BcrD ATPase family protein [Glycomyces tritici]MDN3242920.1 BadF/BadG/BcrA/BcrD ATPase family protein [Glycomyces tritici]